MKKLLLVGALLSLGTASCRSSCPAYTSARPAPSQATPAASSAPSLLASAASPGTGQ